MRRCLHLVLVVAILLSFSPQSIASAYNGRPKLVVVIVVDQFRGDYLERYRRSVEGAGLVVRKVENVEDVFFVAVVGSWSQIASVQLAACRCRCRAVRGLGQSSLDRRPHDGGDAGCLPVGWRLPRRPHARCDRVSALGTAGHASHLHARPSRHSAGNRRGVGGRPTRDAVVLRARGRGPVHAAGRRIGAPQTPP